MEDFALSSFDVVGDIAIVEVPEGSDGRDIGKRLIKEHRNIKVVLAKKGEVEGEFRVRDYEILASDDNRDFSFVPANLRPTSLTETVHRESGCRFKVDPTKAYFSVRLGNERMRIAKLVKDYERILVMFAGAGPYPVVIARHSKPDKIFAIEKNPDAFDCMVGNIVMNKVQGSVKAMLGDVKEVVPDIPGRFDRVIMPLPKSSETFLELVLPKVIKGGTIHLYRILHENDLQDFLGILDEQIPGSKIDVIKAGAYAPGSWRYCFDIKLS
ncbi:MAG: class I SAM-dependent methyltransferase family protein [Candidatus Altiarchaeota archaeon]|nr:class I SAM-dependent methyltransferase family protein [Candidatus Altiarchaeota archaeon]